MSIKIFFLFVSVVALAGAFYFFGVSNRAQIAEVPAQGEIIEGEDGDHPIPGEASTEIFFASGGQSKIGQVEVVATESEQESLKLLEEYEVWEVPREHMQNEDSLVFEVAEVEKGEDLNGDGDISDEVIGWLDRATGEVFISHLTGRYPVLAGGWIAFITPEWQVKEDLNRNGTEADAVLRLYHPKTNRVLNTTAVGLDEDLRVEGGFVYYTAMDGTEERYKIPE